MQMDWRSVCFTDEKKFNLDGPDCCNYYWYHLGTDTKIQPSRQARGGSIMVWGGICCNNKTDLILKEKSIQNPTKPT